MQDQLASVAVPSSGEKTFLFAEITHSKSDIVTSISPPKHSTHSNKDHGRRYLFMTRRPFNPPKTTDNLSKKYMTEVITQSVHTYNSNDINNMVNFPTDNVRYLPLETQLKQRRQPADLKLLTKQANSRHNRLYFYFTDTL